MDSDFKYMSYEEAARELNIKIDSVRVMSRRYKWPKRKGNDKKTLVGIPIERLLNKKGSTSTALSTIDGTGTENSSGAENRNRAHFEFEKKIAILETELKFANEKIDIIEKQCIDLKIDRDAWREQAKIKKRRWFWQK